MAHLPREPEAFGEQVSKMLKRHFPDRIRAWITPPLTQPIGSIPSTGRQQQLPRFGKVLRRPPRISTFGPSHVSATNSAWLNGALISLTDH